MSFTVSFRDSLLCTAAEMRLRYPVAAGGAALRVASNLLVGDCIACCFLLQPPLSAFTTHVHHTCSVYLLVSSPFAKKFFASRDERLASYEPLGFLPDGTALPPLNTPGLDTAALETLAAAMHRIMVETQPDEVCSAATASAAAHFPMCCRVARGSFRFVGGAWPWRHRPKWAGCDGWCAGVGRQAFYQSREQLRLRVEEALIRSAVVPAVCPANAADRRAHTCAATADERKHPLPCSHS